MSVREGHSSISEFTTKTQVTGLRSISTAIVRLQTSWAMELSAFFQYCNATSVVNSSMIRALRLGLGRDDLKFPGEGFCLCVMQPDFDPNPILPGVELTQWKSCID